MIVIKKAIC